MCWTCLHPIPIPIRSLSDNDMDAKGVGHLSEALKVNKTLTSLKCVAPNTCIIRHVLSAADTLAATDTSV